MNPTVTVLMTVFNGEAYLEESINSVLRQSYKNFEFLIIDDCSTDNSLAILKSYNDPRIKLIAHRVNKGQVASLNEGLHEAQGELVARMDADDYISPRWLEFLVPFIQVQQKCAVVSARAYASSSNAVPLRILSTPKTYEGIVLKSLIASPINHVGSVMRRDLVIKEGGYPQDFKIAADYDLWSRLLRRGYRIENYPKTFISVRFHRKSLSASEKDNLLVLEMAKIIKDNILHYTNFPIKPEQVMLVRNYAHAPYVMNDQDYKQTDFMIGKIYGSFKEDKGIARSYIQKFLNQTRMASHSKRFLGRLMSNFFHA